MSWDMVLRTLKQKPVQLLLLCSSAGMAFFIGMKWAGVDAVSVVGYEYLLAGLVFVIFYPFFIFYPRVSGKWSLPRWTARLIYTYYLPYGLFWSYTASLIPTFAFIPVFLCSFGYLMLLGWQVKRHMIIATIVFTFSFLLFMFINARDYLFANPAQPLATISIFIVFVLAVLLPQNDYFKRQLAQRTQGMKKLKEQREELVRNEAFIRALADLTRKVNESPEIQTILKQIQPFLNSRYGVDSIWVAIADDDKEFIQCRYHYSSVPWPEKSVNTLYDLKVPLRKGGGTVMYTFRRRKSLYLNVEGQKYSTEYDRIIAEMGNIKTSLQVPIVLRGESIGVFLLTSHGELLDLDQEQISQIEQLALQVAGAIYQSLLLERAEQQRRRVDQARDELAALGQLTRQVNEAADLNLILQELLPYVHEQFSIDSIWVAVADEKGEYLRPDYHHTLVPWPEEDVRALQELEVPLKKGGGTLMLTYRRKKTLYIYDALDPELVTQAPTEYDEKIRRHGNLRTILQVPLIVQGKTIGIFCFTRRGECIELSKEQLLRIEQLSMHVAGAIHQSLLLERAEMERLHSEKAHMEVEALSEFSRRLNQNSDPSAVIEGIFSYMKKNFRVEGLALLVKYPGVDFLRMLQFEVSISVTDDDRRRLIDLHIPVDERGGLNASVMKRKRTVALRRLPAPGNEYDATVVDILQLKSLVLIPLVVQNEAIGVLGLGWNRTRMDLQSREISAIERFTSQIATAVHNSIILNQLRIEQRKSEDLLLTLMPEAVARQLMANGRVEPQKYDSVSILFSDFVNFSNVASNMDPAELLDNLDHVFMQFDEICQRYGVEKLKTIGDAYMAAGGLPDENRTHPLDLCLAALEMMQFIRTVNESRTMLDEDSFWEMRIGIHSGPVMAGIVGKSRFTYDAWGDAVNVASRMESAGEPGKVNVSESVYEQVKYFFICRARGTVAIKNLGEQKMYFIERIRPAYSADETGIVPNAEFFAMREKIQRGGRVRYRSEVDRALLA